MRIGTRIVRPEDLHGLDAEVVQISMYRTTAEAMDLARRCAQDCTKRGIPYVTHPVGVRLLDALSWERIAGIASFAGLGIILHDERGRDGGRLSGPDGEEFRRRTAEIAAVTSLSFENAVNTADIFWFWDNYADSITIDIGHMEEAGIDSVQFMSRLDRGVLEKVEFVHMHRNGEFRNGLTDHWFLTRDCRELKALGALVEMKRDIDVILEINETDRIGESLQILRELRDRIFSAGG